MAFAWWNFRLVHEMAAGYMAECLGNASRESIGTRVGHLAGIWALREQAEYSFKFYVAKMSHFNK